MENNLRKSRSLFKGKKDLGIEKPPQGIKRRPLLAFTVMLGLIFHLGISKSYSQCPISGTITVSSSVNWSAIPELSTCSNQLITNGGNYTGNVTINVSGSSNTINVNRSITINGNLNLTSNANNNVFQIASGTTLTIIGDLGDAGNNNLQFTVLGGGTLIVTGTVYGNNNNLVGGSGVLSAGAIVTSGNINCATGGCPVLSITNCSSGGTVCSTNNTGSSICTASYGGSIESDQSTCAANLVPSQLTNTGYTGTILRWEKSVDGGKTWTGIANVTPTYTPPTLTVTTKYKTVVLNQTGTTCHSYSSIATLAVGAPVAAGTITGQATVCKPSTGITYTVPVINGATSYIWAYSAPTGVTINGTGNTVTLDFTSAAASGNLTVTGKNDCGNGTVSANYAISVSAGVVATLTAPSNVNVCHTGTAATVTLSGTNLTRIDWTNSNTNIGLASSGNDVASPFTVPSFTATNPGTNPITGTVTVTPKNNACPGSPVSYTYTIRPSATPVITSQPSIATQSICQNAVPTALSVTATGTGVTYQWYRNATNSNSGGTLISGANNPTYSPPTSTVGTTYYYVVVTGCPNSATSSVSGAITVKTAPSTPNITGTLAYTVGGNFALSASSSVGASYAWTPPASATGLSSLAAASINKAIVQTTEAGTYSVIATLNGCPSASASAVVTVTAPPTISTSGTLSALTTVYGTASSAISFNVSGQSITQANGISILAPTGYELSTSSTFASNVGTTINVGAAGTIASTPVYVRLAATTSVGSYNGNVVLSSTGASNVNVATVTSTVTPKSLTITGTATSNKVYDGTNAATLTGGSLVGVLPADAANVNLTLSGTFASVNVGIGIGIASNSSISGTKASNYTLSHPTLTARNITARPLTITAGNVTKTYGATLLGGTGFTTFTSGALVGSETIGSVTIVYGPGAAANAAVNTYSGSVIPSAATGGSFSASNYSITYTPGNIIVNPAALTITAKSTSKCFGTNLTIAQTEFTSSGLLNSDAINSVNLNSAGSGSGATVAGSPYSIVPSLATGNGLGNYTITYANGVLNVISLPAITTQPIDISKCFGDNATFSVLATGAGVSYQWKKGPSNIASANSSSYTINNVSTSDMGSYSVVVSGTCPSPVTSNTVNLTVATTSTWSGTSSSDWNTGSNWTCGIVPNSGLDVNIPSGPTLFPVIGTNATGNAKNLNVSTGATLSLSSGSTLNVYGNWSNAGTFIPSIGTVDFKGTSAQTIDKSGLSNTEKFFNLSLSGGNTLTLSPTTSIDIVASGTVSVTSGDLNLNNRPFTLKSWAPYAYGRHISDSTARLGRVIGTIQNAANFAIERYIATPIETNGKSYVKQRYVCSPVQSLAASQWAETVTILGGSGANAFRVLSGWNPALSTLQSYYEPSTAGSVSRGFRPVLDKTTVMKVGQGYSLSVGLDGNIAYSLYGSAQNHVILRSKGIPTVGDVSVPLTKSGADPYGWNLVGNPYPGEIDWDQVWAANPTVVSSTVSQFDPQGSPTSGQYYYYNARTGKTVDPRYPVDSTMSSVRLNRSVIASSQGFFVFARNQGNSSLLFKEAHKPSTTSRVIGNYRVGADIATVNIGVSNGNLHDNTLVYFDPSANTFGYDADLDAFKSANTGLGISTNSYGKELAMNGVSSEKGIDIPVTVNASLKGSYRLLVKSENSDLVGSRLYLKDGYTGTMTEISEEVQTFPFEVTTNSSIVRRFSIVSSATGPITTGADAAYSADSEIKIFPNPVVGDKLTIQLPKGNGSSRQVEITDLNGVLVYKMDVQATSANFVVQGLPQLLSSGVYTVRVVGEEGVKQQKFVYLK